MNEGNKSVTSKAALLVDEAMQLASQIIPDQTTQGFSPSKTGFLSAGLKEKRRGGLGTQFWQFRDYQSTDTPRSVDWKRTARGDSLIVREREQEQADLYRFWVDPLLKYKEATSPHRYKNKYEFSCLLAVALARIIHELEDRTLVFSDDQSRSGRGLRTLEAHAIEFLSKHAPDLTRLKNIKSSPSETAFLFSDFWIPTEALKADLIPVLQHFGHGYIIQIADPEELSFPFLGRTQFKPTQNADWSYKVEDAAAVRDVYLERIKRHQQELAGLCRLHGWTYISNTTADAPQDILGLLYRSIIQSGPGKDSGV